MLLERKAQGDYAIVQGQKDGPKENGKPHGVMTESVSLVKNMMNALGNMIFHLVTVLGAGMDREIQNVRPHQVDIYIDVIRVVSCHLVIYNILMDKSIFILR